MVADFDAVRPLLSVTVTVYDNVPVLETVPLVADVLVVVVEIPGPEKVYDFILLPVPAVHPDTLTVNLFLFCTKIFRLVPSFVVMFTGSNVIVPTEGTTSEGIVTVNVFELVPICALVLFELYVVNVAVIVPEAEFGNCAYTVVLLNTAVPEIV